MEVGAKEGGVELVVPAAAGTTQKAPPKINKH